MGRRGLPDRWLSYRPVGERIAGTSFICFKVPLKETMVQNLPQNERFTTRVLMESVPNVGLVIDLTNTDRYYDSKDFLGQGIRYEKIFCRGHEIPSQSVVDKFFSIVDSYVEYLQTDSAYPENEKLIGVHCTHGLNRTGYLVCRYMIRRLGFAPKDAIAAFEKARGYPMEREEYLKSLREDKNCSLPVDCDVNQQNWRVDDNSRDDRHSHSSSSHSQGRTYFPPHETANSYQRFPENAGNYGFRGVPRVTGADGYWRHKNDGRGDSDKYATFPRNAPISRHSELGAYFYPEERVSHNSRGTYRRFCEPEFEENLAVRQHPYDYEHRSLSARSSRQSSPWVYRRNRDSQY